VGNYGEVITKYCFEVSIFILFQSEFLYLSQSLIHVHPSITEDKIKLLKSQTEAPNFDLQHRPISSVLYICPFGGQISDSQWPVGDLKIKP
jgi:hypothetical protein